MKVAFGAIKFVLIGVLFFEFSCGAHKITARPLELSKDNYWEYRYEYCRVTLEISRPRKEGQFLRFSSLNLAPEAVIKVRLFGTSNGLLYEPAMYNIQLGPYGYNQHIAMVQLTALKPILNTWLWVEVMNDNSKPCYFKVRFEK